uniref:Variant surface glycoprotein 579 n=1 Tax=Trypanosoma brucei TaxID=5691 RepID=M4T213_9TRYP|nr:variant surface glycoprotein 579 [Trypanosoma brucei]
MTSKQATTLAFIAITLVQLSYVTDGSSPAFSETGIRTLCGIASALQSTAPVSLDRLSKLANAAAAAEEVKNKLLVEALTTGDADSAIVFAAAAAAAAADSCATKAVDQLKAAIPKALRATSTATMGAGAITGFTDMLQKVTASHDNRKCISSSAGTSSTHLGDPTKLGCPAYETGDLTPLAAYNGDQLKATGFTTLSSATNSIVITGNTNCPFLTGGSGDGAKLWEATATTIISDLIDITGAAAGTATASVKQVDNIANNWKVNGPTNSLTKKLMAAAGSAQLIEPPPCATDVDDLLDHLLNPQSLRQHVETALKGLKNQTKGKEGEQTTDLINKVAGKTSDQAKQLKAKLSKTKGKILENDNPILKPLSELGGDEGLADALLHALSEVKTPKTADTNCPETGSAAADSAADNQIKDCSKKTGDNCKDGCKWDSDGPDKKCVKDPNYAPPQAEGAEKDSKTGTTNTTGSNSFLIKKAPLILAVFLF